jgi:hypothetical protein
MLRLLRAVKERSCRRWAPFLVHLLSEGVNAIVEIGRLAGRDGCGWGSGVGGKQVARRSTRRARGRPVTVETVYLRLTLSGWKL